jgi:hypothetical protein
MLSPLESALDPFSDATYYRRAFPGPVPSLASRREVFGQLFGLASAKRL